MNNADKQRIKVAVIDTLSNFSLAKFNKISLPVPIKKIVKSFENCRLIPYSMHMQRQNLTYEEMLKFAGTKDALTDYDKGTGQYIIYYNDINELIMKTNRYRWNIAHELGHVALLHHQNNEKTRLFRNQLTRCEYYKLEEEADMFAAYILVPHAILYLNKIKNMKQISELCRISTKAAFLRYSEYVTWLTKSKFKDSYDHKWLMLFNSKVVCSICSDESDYRIRKGHYCQICGSKKYAMIKFETESKDVKMKYKETPLTENGKTITCMTCENENILEDGDFCQICGKHVINRCAQEENNDFYYQCTDAKGKHLPSNARYCPYCGGKTTFLRDGILKPWDEEILQEELPF